MKGQRIGYVRVSTLDQNPDRQLEGMDLDRVFVDKASGKDTNRPNLQEMLQYVRTGDHVLIHSMDRLARNLVELRTLVKEMTDRGIAVQFVKENLTFTGEDTPIATLLLSVMGSVAEFERAIIRERQREGIELAKKRGVYKGRKPTLSPEQIADLKEKVAMGIPKTQVAMEFGISRQTLYQYLNAEDTNDS